MHVQTLTGRTDTSSTLNGKMKTRLTSHRHDNCRVPPRAAAAAALRAAHELYATVTVRT
jgi:hypothetical protein